MEVLILLIVGLACAGYSSAVAEAKGFDKGSWALGGFFFGPLALFASLGLPDRKAQRYLRLLAEHQGIEAEASPTTTIPANEGETVDEQRKRILGLK